MAGPDVETTTTSDEMVALRAENEALRIELESKAEKGSLWRRIVAVVLAVLTVVAVLLSVSAVWLQTTLSDEDRFVGVLGSLPRDESVATALSVRVADGVIEATGFEAFVVETLPDGLTFIAAPVTDSARDLVARAAVDVVRSDQVTAVWTAALRVTHTAVSAVLSGNDGALVAEGGQVAIDLDEVAEVVVERVEAAGLDIPDTDIDLGRVVILESDQLRVAQGIARGIDQAAWFLPLLAVLLIAATIWVAPSSRRMTAILSFAIALALLLELAASRIARTATLGTIEDEVSRNAAGAVWDILLATLIQGTWAVLVVALIVGLIAWLIGPGSRAQSVRRWGTATIEGWQRPREAEPSGFTAFLIESKRTIQVVVVVLGVLFLLFGPAPSGLLVLVTTVVVLLLLGLVSVLAGPPQRVGQKRSLDA